MNVVSRRSQRATGEPVARDNPPARPVADPSADGFIERRMSGYVNSALRQSRRANPHATSSGLASSERPHRFFLLPFLTILCLLGCRAHDDAAAKIPVPVRVRVVEEQNAAALARYSGTIDPATRVDVAFKVSGYLRDLAMVNGEGGKRKIQEGDFVTAGTVLAVVRETDYQQQVRAAQAAYAEAIALSRQARIESDRSSKLFQSDSISKSDVDTTRARRDAAFARVSGAAARIEAAKLALADCTLKAPIDGVVLKRPAEVGALVGPGTVGFVVAETRSVKVVFGVPDTVVEKLKLGSSLAVTFEAVPGEFTGKISRIAPSADARSRVFEVEGTIPNPKNELKVGMIASLKVPDGAHAGTPSLVLPLTAVVRPPGAQHGFSVVVAEGQPGSEIARLRSVKLGEVFGNAVLVTDGLNRGERVVSMGATLVADGAAIRIIP